MTKQNRAAIVYFVSLGLLFPIVYGETVTQLQNNYSGTTDWNAGTGTLTFTSTGTIDFVGKSNYKNHYWDVPSNVTKIVIGTNVTVTGAFHTHSTCTIEGIDRKTSIIFGTNEQRWADSRNLKAYNYCHIQNWGGTTTVRNLTMLNPFSYFIRGWGKVCHAKSCDFIDNRGGWGNHSDGFSGGHGSTVDDCYFEAGDDVIKCYFDITVTNTHIHMVQNSVPFQFGWGTYQDSHSVLSNITITGDWGRGSARPIFQWKSGSDHKTVVMDNCTIQNPTSDIFELQSSGRLDLQVTNSLIDVDGYGTSSFTGTRMICGSTVQTNFYDCTDNIPPTPNPAQWDMLPSAMGNDTVSMAAVPGTDIESPPVEYYFTETTGHYGAADSGWQSDPYYELSGLAPGTQYCFNVKMKDAHGNETNASSDAYVITTGTADLDPPLPDPPAFEISPHLVDNTVMMTAVTGVDSSGPVEYYFAEITGNPGSDDSGWQVSPVYTDTDLSEGTSYTYTVKIRDAYYNETVFSDPITVCTRPNLDIVRDGVVDLLDLSEFISRWLNENCCLDELCGGCDLDASGTVNNEDFSILSDNWLAEVGPSEITLEYFPVDDAYRQGTAYYNTDQLRVEYNNRTSYLKFNVTDIPTGYNVSSVMLEFIENGDNGNGTLRFHRGTNSPWTEANLNVSNEPSPADEVGVYAGSVGVGQTMIVDVTPLVVANGIYSLIVTMDAGGNDIWFGSKESTGKEPKLTIIAER